MPLHVANAELEYTIAAGESERIATAIRLGFDAWSARERSELVTRYVGLVSEASLEDERSTVASYSGWPDELPDPAATVAFTPLFFDSTTGRIRAADVLLNAERFSFDRGPGSYDARSVVAHEAGHAIGLAHSCGDAGSSRPSCFSLSAEEASRILEAVMAPSASPSTIRRELTPDDVDGLLALYPRTEPRAAPPTVSPPSCVGGAIHLEGTPSDARVWLRSTSDPEMDLGTLGAFDDRLKSDGLDGSAELIISTQGGAFVSFETPKCEVEPAPGDGSGKSEPGCGCASSGGGSTGLSLLVGLLALFSLGLERLMTERRFSRRAGWKQWACALAVLAAPTPAAAYKCSRTAATSGPSLVWNIRTVPFVIDARLTADVSNQELVVSEIVAAYGAWSNADCSDFTFSYEGKAANAKAGFDPELPNQNLVTFLSSGWPYDPAIIAVTTNAFDSVSGIVFDSDIEVNDERFEFVVANENGSGCSSSRGQMDLRNAITHEAGHVLGLDHPPPTRSYARTTMFASAPSCETQKRSLEADDIEGLCFIYPEGQATRACYSASELSFSVVEADDGFGCRVTRERGSVLALATLLILSRATRRRIRRSWKAPTLSG
ncbi:MAG: matrixin family metalloprotease [Deltaproteobacteria bacterium]|nr:matrixin family metalloprotease [Deltaproteobacteria bacterium]